MKALVLNCGSSSLKFHLYEMPREILMVQGSAEKNDSGNASLSIKWRNKEVFHREWQEFSLEEILTCVLNELQDPKNHGVDSLSEIDVVGHRLIHGRENDDDVVEITGHLISYMKSNISLAPLHYPANLRGILAIKKLAPNVLQTGVFDSAFHRTLPPKAFLYGIPMNWYREHHIRKYGFHGISHKYVAQRSCEITDVYFEKSKIITCHLGNGASVAAIRNGKSIDTSMGMTPVEGLLMGTRSGDIDAGVLVYLQQNYKLSAGEINSLINERGGLLGLSGVSSDYREVEKAAASGNKNAKIALDVYHYRIKKYIGSYLAVLGGAHLLVFTGGVGENSVQAREEICSGMEDLGISLSHSLNQDVNGTEAVISKTASKIQVVVVPTNEQLMIAREAAKLVMRKEKKP